MKINGQFILCIFFLTLIVEFGLLVLNSVSFIKVLHVSIYWYLCHHLTQNFNLFACGMSELTEEENIFSTRVV